MTKILAIVNQKGGVGKTTTATNLGTAICAVGYRVLLIDGDPQGNATSGLGVVKVEKEKSTYFYVLGKASSEDVLQKTSIENLHIIPANMHLAAAEVELPDSEEPTKSLKIAIKSIVHKYDYILIDCPPSLGFLTLNSMVASTHILVPLQCEYYALEGLSHLLSTVKRVRQQLNPNLEVAGILLTMFDRRNNLSSMVENDVRKHLKDLVYNTVIPRNVRVSEAPSYGQPVLIYDIKSSGAMAYMKLAAEIISHPKTKPLNLDRTESVNTTNGNDSESFDQLKV